MKRSDNQDDQTRISKPGKAGKNIPARLQASVVIVEGKVKGMEYAVTKTYTVIGRSKTADITPRDTHISRRHAVIVYLDGSYLIQDLNSTNGTFMNGAQIKQADLKHGDKFSVGETTFQFIVQENPRNQTYEIG